MIFVSYSENRGNGKSSTSVASAVFDSENLQFNNIFRAEPPIRFKDSAEKYGFNKEDAIIFKIGEVSPLEKIL